MTTALFEPLPATPSTHILKPDHQGGDYPASVMNEYFTMGLAEAVGLDVPAVHRLLRTATGYLVDRFDRILPKETQQADWRCMPPKCGGGT